MLIQSNNVSASIKQRQINGYAIAVWWAEMTKVGEKGTFLSTCMNIIMNHCPSAWNCVSVSLCARMAWCVCDPLYPVRSFLQSQQGAERPTVPDQRWAHRGWAGLSHNKESCGALWLWTSHRGRAPCSSHNTAHYALLVHLGDILRGKKVSV